MIARPLLILLLLVVPLSAEPSFTLPVPGTIRISWPAECGKQYAVSTSRDLENWTQLGKRLLGVDGVLTTDDGVGGGNVKFYRVETYEEFLLDLLRLKFSRVGNKWSYDVVEDGLFGQEVYVWDSRIFQRTTFGGHDVVEWRFTRAGEVNWDRIIYILDDFTTGIFEVGGEAADGTVQTNIPPSPTLVSTFTPGTPFGVSYHNLNGLGDVTGSITITVDKGPVVVPAGSFTNLIRVTHEFSANPGLPLDGFLEEWFALDVGLVRHASVLDFGAGIQQTTTFSLRSFEVQ